MLLELRPLRPLGVCWKRVQVRRLRWRPLALRGQKGLLRSGDAGLLPTYFKISISLFNYLIIYYQYMRWDSILAIVPVCVSCFGILLTITVISIFVRHSETPIVKVYIVIFLMILFAYVNNSKCVWSTVCSVAHISYIHIIGFFFFGFWIVLNINWSIQRRD